MPTFTLKPDLRVLYHYLTDSTVEEFDKINPGYLPGEMQLEFDWSVIEDVVAFEKDFKDILKKSQLLNHYDTLLYLILTIFDQLWEQISLIHENHQSKIKAKQIAQLLLLLKSTKPGKLRELRVGSLIDTVRIVDPTVNDWIAQTLTKALESKQFPIGKFGNDVLMMLSVDGNPLTAGPADIDLLKHYSNLRLTNPKNSINKRIAVLAVIILEYLENETEMKGQAATLCSDEQAVFISDVLHLLKQIDNVALDSFPKDYIRTLINNHIK